VARPGHVFLSADYSSNELVSLADKCVQLFGRSVAADMINAGVDLHAFLAAQIAYEKWPDFRAMCDADEIKTQQARWEAFHDLKGCPFFGKEFSAYRKLAKPVGLGFPGGLGAATFVSFAKGYGVEVTEEEARHLKEIWLDSAVTRAFRAATVEAKPICRECPLKFLCGGGDMEHAYFYGGAIEAHDPYCELHQAMFADALQELVHERRPLVANGKSGFNARWLAQACASACLADCRERLGRRCSKSDGL